MHSFPRIDKALKMIVQSPSLLTDPLPHNQNMNSRTPATESVGIQIPFVLESGHGCINMFPAIHVVTYSHDYGVSQLTIGKEPPPPNIPLRIDKPGTTPSTERSP